MSPTMKISLLALATSAAAIPHFGHEKFHNKPRATGAVGAGKPYPAGGWGSYNSTRVPSAAGTGSYDDNKTIDTTSTRTTTLVKTVVVKPSPVPAPESKAVIENVQVSSHAAVSSPAVAPSPAGGQCGPATVTVTASEKVTVTVTPGSGYGASAPPAAPVKPEQPTTTSTVYSTTKVEATSTIKASGPSPQAPKPYPETPQASSKAEEYKAVVPSVAPVVPVAQKPDASSAAPSSAASSPASGPANTYSGTKRGLAYNDASLCSTFGGNFGFGYNWGQVENGDIGTQYIPMMHGPSMSTPEEWLANVDKAVQKGSRAVMGFNEPDISTQANLSPEAACAAWKEYLNPISSRHPSVNIIGPAVSNGPPSQGMGLGWLSKFHDVCPDAIIHATNIHFYDIYDSSTMKRFESQVEQAAQLYGKPVWVTEFGLNPGSATDEEAASFLKQCMSYLDSSDKVQGYSWFMVGNGQYQLNSGSGLSALGQIYAATS